jgi:hypothetical protein
MNETSYSTYVHVTNVALVDIVHLSLREIQGASGIAARFLKFKKINIAT